MNDNELLEHLAAAARQQHIVDNGFTDRVMAALPASAAAARRMRRLSRLWTAACVAVAVVLLAWLCDWSWLRPDWHLMPSRTLALLVALSRSFAFVLRTMLTETSPTTLIVLFVVMAWASVSWAWHRLRLFM